jgi:hypothetical protein
MKDLLALAKTLKGLTKEEIVTLMSLIKDIGGNKVTVEPQDDPVCPQGFVWSAEQGKCIADVGGFGG